VLRGLRHSWSEPGTRLGLWTHLGTQFPATVFGLLWGVPYLVAGQGLTIAQAHLRHLNPFPANLEAVLRSYDRVVIPEMNLGQLALLIRGRFLVDAVPYNKVAGLPFKAEELQHVLTEHLNQLEGVPA